MNFKRRVTLKLKNLTPEHFQLWKDITPEVNEIFSKYGIEVSDIVYKDGRKMVTVEYDEFETYSQAVIDVCQFGASKGVMIEQVSIKDIVTTGNICKSLIVEYKGRRKYA